MKKILFTLCVTLLSMLSPMSVSAQGTAGHVTVVNVNTKDGSVSRFLITSKPVVHIVDDRLVVKADELADLELLRDEVSHIDFSEDGSSALDAANLGENDFTLSFIDNNTVQIVSPRLTRADLFDIAGHKLASASTADGNITLSLAELPAGVYVVAPDCHTAVKIVKK